MNAETPQLDVLTNKPSRGFDKVTGGVLIAKGENWYFPCGTITSDETIEGWSRLDWTVI